MTPPEPSTEEKSRLARRNRITAYVLFFWFLIAFFYAMSEFRISG